eukprot:g36166.t1
MEVYDATMIRQDTMLAERPKTSLSIWRSLALVFGGLIVGTVSHRWSVAHRYRDNAYSSSPLENSELDFNHKMDTLQVARDGSKSKSERKGRKDCKREQVSPYLGGPNAVCSLAITAGKFISPGRIMADANAPIVRMKLIGLARLAAAVPRAVLKELHVLLGERQGVHLEVHRCVGLGRGRLELGSLKASIAARTLMKLRWTCLHVGTSLFWVQGLSFFPSLTVTS